MEKLQPGRPPRNREEGASKIVPIRMTEAELARYQQAAKRAGAESVSAWIRDRLDRAAKREARRN